MNFGEDFSIPQGKEFEFTGSWIPVTPQKPIPTGSNPIQVSDQGNQFGKENWQEFGGFPTGYVQDILNNNGVAHSFNQDQYFGSINLAKNNRMINNIAGSYRLVLQNESSSWNDHTWANLLATRNAADGFASANRIASLGSGNTLPIPNLHSQEDNWRRCSSHQSSSSHFMRNTDGFLQMPQYGFPIPSMPVCNLNSPARTEVGAPSHFNTSFQSLLATPDQTEKTRNQNPAADENSVSEKEQESLIVCNKKQFSQQNRDLLQNIVDSSSVIISAPMEEKDSERGSVQGIDLNKTPQQKPPKRRKHRPKVIVEGKPKRTPKPTTTANVNSKDNPSGKRKYVRRKGLTEPATQHADPTKASDSTAGTPVKRKYVHKKSLKEPADELIDSANKSACDAGITIRVKCMHETNQKEPATPQGDCIRDSDPSPVCAPRSCRRALNFDLENTGNGSLAGTLNHQEMLSSKSSESHSMGFSSVGNGGFKTRFTTQSNQQSGLAVENLQLQAECSHSPFLKKMMPIDYMSLPGITAATASRLQAKELMENVNVMARNANMYDVDLNQNSYRNGYTSAQQAIQFVSQRRNWENIDGTKEFMFEGHPQSVATVLTNSNEGRGSKRDHYHAIEQGQFSTAGTMSSLLSQAIFQADEGYRNGYSNEAAFPQALKRRVIEDEFHAYKYGMKCSVSRAAGLLQTKGTNDVNAGQFTSLRDCGTSDPQVRSDNIDRRKGGVFSQLTGNRYVNSTAGDLTSSKQNILSQLHSGIEKVGNINGLALVHNLATIENRNLLLPTTPEKVSTPRTGLVGQTFHTNVSENKKREPGLPRNVPSRVGKMVQEKKQVSENQQSTKARGPSAKHVSLNPVEEMINRFKGLTLEEKNNKPKAELQNALVLYNGAGTVVPYEGFESIKKKVRPRVDLDPETNRVWNLLMGKEGEDTEGTDKEKWWEEERRVFHGRVDSFIARMHLVQGTAYYMFGPNIL